jgi:hypothetical protein
MEQSLSGQQPRKLTQPHGASKKTPPLKETAEYVADMLLELRNLAKACDLKALQGLLEVSYYEAFSAANKVEVPPEELERLRELSKASAV